MNCYCGAQVKCATCKSGGLSYSCALGRCRFFALAPVQADGYRRVLPPPAGRGESVVVRFEAVLHPEKKTTHVTAAVSTCDCEAVISVLEDARFQPMWYPAKEAYLYPMESYNPLTQALKEISAPRLEIEAIPNFFFRCLTAAQEIQLQHERNIDGNASQPVDEDDVVYSQLRSFQKKGVDFIIARGGRGMIADDMGLGKTVQAIAVAHHYRSEWPVLVVCPLSLVENWAKEFVRFCSIPIGRIAILQTTKVSVTDVHSVIIVPYSSLKSLDALSITFQVVILDESHYIKTVASKRTTAALKFCRLARRVLLLSGTPTLSRPIELYPQLQAIIHPSCIPTKTQFGARYCNAFLGRFGPDYTGHSNMSELHVLLQHFVIRRTKRGLGDDLPSKSRQLLYVYITPKEKKALEKSVLALRNSLGNGTATLPCLGGGSVSNYNNSGGASGNSGANTRSLTAFDLKIATARAKIAAVQDYVKSTAEQMVESGQKVIIFAHHQCMMEAIRAAVESVQPKQPLDYIYITGETPAVQRESLATHFRSSPNCHVAILSMHSCGLGHNLTCASIVVFAELDWNPSTHLQCEDRVHRIGQSSPCVIKYLLAEGTSDSVIWPMLQTKLTVTHAVLEDTAAAEGWSAGADTRRITRSDVPLTPSSQPNKQTTLEGFLSHSASRPTTQSSQENNSNNNSGNNNAKASDGRTQTEASPGKLRASQTAEAAKAEKCLMDIATLRQRRESRRVPPPSLPQTTAVSPNGRPSFSVHAAGTSPQPSTSTPPLSSSPTQMTLHNLASNQLTKSPAQLKTSPGGLKSFRVAIAIPPAPVAPVVPSRIAGTTTTIAYGATPLHSRTTSSSGGGGGVWVQAASLPLKTSFTNRPSSAPAALSSARFSSEASAVGNTTPVVASTIKEKNSEGILLLPVPRSEEIRHYNSRRTLFRFDSVGEKRPRTEDDK